MMQQICKFCGAHKPLKKNTHYLTDAVIRTCLNQIGSKQSDREKGLYFDISSNHTFLIPHFQRETNLEKIEQVYGRLPNNDEIVKARNTIEYSVDNTFCKECEDKFTEIENNFFQHIEKFKKGEYNDSKTIRKFFYLQLWRSAICNEYFNITEKTMQYMYNSLFNDCELDEMNKLPLSVAYLDTPQGDETENLVGLVTGSNPYVIFMNCFVIQLFDSKETITYYELFETNKDDTFINYAETKFNLQKINNEGRHQIVSNYYESKIDNLINDLSFVYGKIFKQVVGRIPNEKEAKSFIIYATTQKKFNCLFKENIIKSIVEYLKIAYNINFV